MMDYFRSLFLWKSKEELPSAAPKSKGPAGKKGGKQQKQRTAEPSIQPEVEQNQQQQQQPTVMGGNGSAPTKGKEPEKDRKHKVQEEANKSGESKGKRNYTLKALGFLMFLQGFLQQLLIAYALLRYVIMSVWGHGKQGEIITFQEFRTNWLKEKRVSEVQVVNLKWAEVFELVWPDPGLPEGAEGPSPAPMDVFRCKFTLGSLSTFEEKLEEAQRELGYTPDQFVPLKFVSESSELGLLARNMVVMLMASLFVIAVVKLAKMSYSYLSGKDWEQLTSNTRNPLMGRGGLLGSLGGMLGLATPHQLDKSSTNLVKFKDVAGCDEAKGEIMEFVDYLKSPKKYQDIGAQIPKGALLVGPPGTGKTMLARAAAGEASVPFLGMNGSEFCEMFAGIGSSKVRDLFAQARTLAPCIIFIDEIDAIGRARGRRAMGADADRESTLNQLLVEMDGFASTVNVVVLGSTNRADILDKALLRPGRFSRQITVDAPDVKGREQIFRVYLSKLKLAKDMDFYTGRLAALTPGMTGADISNVCNEAALYAGRSTLEHIDMAQFEYAIDRVIGGLEKKDKVISKEERRVVATHESGHAVVSWFLEFAEPLLKVSIVPRGSSTLGFAQYLPNENLLMNKEQLLDNMRGALGGRAAEQVILGKISTGATNDLEKVTQMAYAQVAVYGMNDKIGLLSYRLDKDALDKPYSNETAHMVDTEARLLVSTAYASTVALVEEKRDLIVAMADMLLDKEVIGLDEVERLLGPRPFATTGELRNIDRYRKLNDGAKGKNGQSSKENNGPTQSKRSKKKAANKHAGS